MKLSETTHLRLLEESDLDELHALIEANRERLALWLPWAGAQTLEDTRQFLRGTREQLNRNDGFQAAIVCDGDLAGVVGFRAVDWAHRSTSIGYWLSEEHEGKGVMTEAVRLLVDQALLTWELDRVEISAATENRRSRAIPERLGFTLETVLRRAELVGDRYLDKVVYSMTAGSWKSSTAAAGY